MKREPFPLQWPEGWRRTKPGNRERPRFSSTLFTAAQDVAAELRRMGATHVVITTDMPVRRDGLPYSTGKEPPDVGVAVWWLHDGAERVLACDQWLRIQDNMRAIAMSLAAMRGLDRWGAVDQRRAFAGFVSLPAAGETAEWSNATAPIRPWPEVLGVADLVTTGALAADDLLTIVKARHRKLIATAHPDAGGGHREAAELNVALASAEQELSGGGV